MLRTADVQISMDGRGRTRRWRIGRRRTCTAGFLRLRLPRRERHADGHGAWACGNFADEIPTSPHPSSITMDGDDGNDLDLLSSRNCPCQGVHLTAGPKRNSEIEWRKIMRLVHSLEDLFKKNTLSMGLAAVGLTSLLISTVPQGTAAQAEMAAIDKLVAIEEIRQLKARYFRCVDTRDWDCWRAVFAPDFTIRNSPTVAQVRGPEGMIQLVHENGLYDRVKSVHHGHMPEIEILSPTTARGIWAADFMHYYPPGEPFETKGTEQVALGKGEHVWAHYYDTYVKLGGRWRIQSMEMKQLRQDDTGGITIRGPK